MFFYNFVKYNGTVMGKLKKIACIGGCMVFFSINVMAEEYPKLTLQSENPIISELRLPSSFQTVSNISTPVVPVRESNRLLKHLDLSVHAGTTGIGVDVAAPVGNYLQVRAGFDFMPHFEYDMTFKVRVGDANDADYDNEELQKAKFERLAKMLEQFTGYHVDNTIDMTGEPTLYNFKLLLDVFPFKRNKHWHFTAGFYVGASKIAKARNTIEDMPSLMAVAIYNNMYDRIASGEGIIFTIGGMDIPILNDPEVEDRILENGRMGMHVGDFVSDNTPYVMEPDENNLVRSVIKVNAFRPYPGFGYGGRLFKGNDNYYVSFDCGVLMWGGTPKVLTHDGTNLTKDVVNIKGKVGDYVDIIKRFKAFPVLQVRLTRRLF